MNSLRRICVPKCLAEESKEKWIAQVITGSRTKLGIDLIEVEVFSERLFEFDIREPLMNELEWSPMLHGPQGSVEERPVNVSTGRDDKYWKSTHCP
jgi:hypothetical protein